MRQTICTALLYASLVVGLLVSCRPDVPAAVPVPDPRPMDDELPAILKAFLNDSLDLYYVVAAEAATASTPTLLEAALGQKLKTTDIPIEAKTRFGAEAVFKLSGEGKVTQEAEEVSAFYEALVNWQQMSATVGDREYVYDGAATATADFSGPRDVVTGTVRLEGVFRFAERDVSYDVEVQYGLPDRAFYVGTLAGKAVEGALSYEDLDWGEEEIADYSGTPASCRVTSFFDACIDYLVLDNPTETQTTCENAGATWQTAWCGQITDAHGACYSTSGWTITQVAWYFSSDTSGYQSMCEDNDAVWVQLD